MTHKNGQKLLFITYCTTERGCNKIIELHTLQIEVNAMHKV